ncbi:hypothetical protein L596_013321 [Steinernema carpocapsae]|uniref:non-specific serine/threonine protein kinase n=1 Tax=Steinernema carpocapsae TaxID=34508 RepID=A0A4U5P0H0_STECR|nr:hypothetical protein L596_013321 [Steinernema carpocapsae]
MRQCIGRWTKRGSQPNPKRLPQAGTPLKKKVSKGVSSNDDIPSKQKPKSLKHKNKARPPQKISQNETLNKVSFTMAPKDDRKALEEGEQLHGNHGTYIIKKRVGSGGFGDVYKVVKSGDKPGNSYALKTEIADAKASKLKLEILILSAVRGDNKPRDEDGKLLYFPEYHDNGKTPYLTFMVMDLLGPSVDDIRKKRCTSGFSQATAVKLALKMLDPIRELHNVGYIHRDIKPGNFCTGVNLAAEELYILDFGIAVLYQEINGSHRKESDKRLSFAGTLPFCSRNSLKHRLVSRRDDMESWLYMFFDLCDRNALLWKRIRDPETVLKFKEDFFENVMKDKNTNDDSYDKFRDFKKVVSMVGKMSFYDDPHYDKIKEELKEAAKALNIEYDKPYDWLSTAATTTSEEQKDEGAKKKNNSSGRKKNTKKPEKPRLVTQDGKDDDEKEPVKSLGKSMDEKGEKAPNKKTVLVEASKLKEETKKDFD